jgi:hypothetical protein
MARPDALKLRTCLKRGKSGFERLQSICAIAEPLLGLDRRSKERAHIRTLPQDWLFITLSAYDTLCFPYGHPMVGADRYNWVTMEDGICQFGFLVAGAEDTADPSLRIPIPALNPTWRQPA